MKLEDWAIQRLPTCAYHQPKDSGYIDQSTVLLPRPYISLPKGYPTATLLHQSTTGASKRTTNQKLKIEPQSPKKKKNAVLQDFLTVLQSLPILLTVFYNNYNTTEMGTNLQIFRYGQDYLICQQVAATSVILYISKMD